MKPSPNILCKSKLKIILLCCSTLIVTACDSEKKPKAQTETIQQHQTDVLPYLNIQARKADYAVPFCEKKNCIEIDIQTIKTQDQWLNQWISTNQANVIQNQIDLKQNLTLQQAVNAYVKKSDAWQKELSLNDAYELHLNTRIASQRNQYVLLQVEIHSKQEGVSVKERQYFFVADRKLKKNLTILEVIQPNKQTVFNTWVQEEYQKWLTQQNKTVKNQAPEKLYWKQADWFFDGEGIGLHYRASEIVKEATQLDIYLSKEQTRNIINSQVFEKMF